VCVTASAGKLGCLVANDKVQFEVPMWRKVIFWAYLPLAVLPFLLLLFWGVWKRDADFLLLPFLTLGPMLLCALLMCVPIWRAGKGKPMRRWWTLIPMVGAVAPMALLVLGVLAAMDDARWSGWPLVAVVGSGWFVVVAVAGFFVSSRQMAVLLARSVEVAALSEMAVAWIVRESVRYIPGALGLGAGLALLLGAVVLVYAVLPLALAWVMPERSVGELNGGGKGEAIERCGK
jgi:hypothetical protein